MPGVLYNPNSLEWSTLQSYMGMQALSACIFVVGALSVGWKLIWARLNVEVEMSMNMGSTRKTRTGYVPGFFHPNVFTTFIVLAQLAAGFAGFWSWRAGYRSENAPLYADPLHDEEPTHKNFFWAQLLYTIFFIMNMFANIAVFSLGVGYNRMTMAYGIEFFTFGVGVATTVLFYFTSTTAGIIMTVVSAIYLNRVRVVYVFRKNVNATGFSFDVMHSMYTYVFPEKDMFSHKYGDTTLMSRIFGRPPPQQQGYVQGPPPQGYPQGYVQQQQPPQQQFNVYESPEE